MGSPRQEYWSGLPLSTLGDLPDPGIKPVSPLLQEDSLTSELAREPGGVHSDSNSKDRLSRSTSSIKCHVVLDKSLNLSELQVPMCSSVSLASTYKAKLSERSNIKYKLCRNAIVV